MQSVLARIWTRVTVSISYDDNHYTKGTSKSICLKMNIIAQLGFEFADYKAAVQHFSYYAMWIIKV